MVLGDREQATGDSGMQLTNRTYLVTGGASGLGAGTVRRLAAAGANVVAADVNAVAGQALIDELGAQVAFQASDVTSEASAQAAIDLAISRFGALHGLVNCAGI